MQYDRDRRHLLYCTELRSVRGRWMRRRRPHSRAVNCRHSSSRPSQQRPPSWHGRARCVTKPSARATRPMGRWWCATVSSSERAGTTSCCTPIPPPTPNYWRCATQRAGSGPATFRNARSIRPRPRAPCARALSTGHVYVGCSPRARWSRVSCRGSDVERIVGRRCAIARPSIHRPAIRVRLTARGCLLWYRRCNHLREKPYHFRLRARQRRRHH